MSHIPVLLDKVLEIMDPEPGHMIVDGTVDGGGHAEACIERMDPRGTFVGIDLDGVILNETKERIGSKFAQSPELRFFWQHGSYHRAAEYLEGFGLPKADAFFIDLGFSSLQMDAEGRGFSFSKDAPLDMRYDVLSGPSAADVVSSLKETELADVLWRYGEERYSRVIAKRIVEARRKEPILRTTALAQIIEGAVHPRSRKGRIHPATRTFQALRIYVNRELEHVEEAMRMLPDIVRPGGKALVISFHSLEDRIVKNAFRELVKADRAEFITKKPIVPERREIIENPRSRSAKLRAIQMH